MDYEKEYKKLKASISKAYLYAQTDSTKAVLENILPELKENREERIVKEILNIVVSVPDNKWHGYSIGKEEAIEWLNKNYPRCTYKSTSVNTSDITTATTKISEDECYTIS